MTPLPEPKEENAFLPPVSAGNFRIGNRLRRSGRSLGLHDRDEFLLRLDLHQLNEAVEAAHAVLELLDEIDQPSDRV